MPSAIKSESLEHTSVPKLLAEAWRDRRSGQLILRRGETEYRLAFHDGSPTRLDADASEDRLASFLEDARKITGPERTKVENLAQERDCSQASAVMALGLIENHDLYPLLREATRQQIADLFDWSAGEYAWTSQDDDAADSAKPFDSLKLLQTQLPKRWGTDRLFADLMPQSDRTAEIAPNSRRVVAKLGQQGPLAGQIVAGIDGHSTLGQLLGNCAGDPLAAATIWVLIHTEMIRLREVRDAGTGEGLEFEVLIEETPARGAAASPTQAAHDRSDAASNAAGAKSTDSDTRQNSKSQTLRAEVEALRGQIEDISHYDALGLEIDASPVDIKKAYFKAAKKYHPDTLARLGLEAIRDDAAIVFARIARAFEVLSDKDKKALYDDDGPEPTEIDTARLAQAETSFRKGEILLRMGNFAGSLEYLEPAVELWPEEPAYQAALGWALFKQSKSNPVRARTHLEAACTAAPDDAIILFRLGKVMLAVGESKLGDKMIATARSIEPDISD